MTLPRMNILYGPKVIKELQADEDQKPMNNPISC